MMLLLSPLPPLIDADAAVISSDADVFIFLIAAMEAFDAAAFFRDTDYDDAFDTLSLSMPQSATLMPLR